MKKSKFSRVLPEDRNIESKDEDKISHKEFKTFYGFDHNFAAKVLKHCFGFDCGSAYQCHGQLNLIRKSEFEKAVRRYQRFERSIDSNS